jgi:lambda family phage minor tail protein L
MLVFFIYLAMALPDDIQGLDIEAPIDLFTISNPFNSNFPVTNFCNIGNVSYRGVQYLPIACKVQWIPRDGESTIQTKLIVSDVSGVVGALSDNYGLLGATITAIRTYSIFLDNQPGADPLAYRSFEMRVNQYVASFRREFEFDLVPAANLEVKGGRRYLRRCTWQLSDDRCQAPTNLNFNLNGAVCLPKDRACRKDLTQCQQYHGHVRRFGGFPGVQWQNSR